jgi:hypothetical protein
LGGVHVEILHNTLKLCRREILPIDVIKDIEDSDDGPITISEGRVLTGEKLT